MAGAGRKKHVRFAAPGGEAAAAAAGPRLPAAPQAEVAVAGGGGRRCGRGGEGAALRWCISGALCAAFLGLVSAAAGGRLTAPAAPSPPAASRPRAGEGGGAAGSPPFNVSCRG